MSTTPLRYAMDEAVCAEVRGEVAKTRVPLVALASATNLSRNSISRKINGHSAFSAGELEAVAGVLGTTGAALMDRAKALVRADEGSRLTSAALAEPSPAVVVEPEPAPAVEAHGVDIVEHVGAALADVPVEALLEHEAACDSCWSLDDAARHLSGDEDPATHRSSDEEIA